MALIIPPGFAQAVYRLRLSGDSEPMVTTCGHAIDTATITDPSEIADNLFSRFAAAFDQQFPDFYAITGVDVYLGQDGGAPQVGTSTLPEVLGTKVVSVTPPNSAVLMRKRTDLAGRRGRGRMYLPGIAEGDVDNVGILQTSAINAWQACANAWYSALVDSPDLTDMPPYVLHRSEGEGVEPPPTPIVSFSIDSRIATQRRRLRP